MNGATWTLLAAASALSAGAVASVVGAWVFGGGVGACRRLRRWQALALLVAPLAAALITAFALLAPSFQGWFGVTDHCAGHVHHAHVCLAHPAAWADVPWMAQGLALLLAATLGAGAFRLGFGVLRSLWVTRRLRALSLPVAGSDGNTGYHLLDDDLSGAFSGWGRIFLTRQTRDTLSPAQLGALLAHERAHLERGDPLRVLLVELAGVFQLPFARRALLDAYRASVERQCDDIAARSWGALHLANALLACARHNTRTPKRRNAALAGAGAIDLEHRIRRLADRDAAHPVAMEDPRPARTLAVAAALLLMSWVALPAAEPAHHLLESLLELIR